MVFILAFMHLLVDAVCAATVMSSRSTSTPEEVAILILFYNGLAFSTQPLFGYIADRAGRSERLKVFIQDRFFQASAYVDFAILGAVTVSVGAVLYAIPLLSVSLAGIGNSIFHVGGGGYSLNGSAGKAAKVGVFVGPGAIGLTLGLSFPHLLGALKVILAILALVTLGISYALFKGRIARNADAPVQTEIEMLDTAKYSGFRPEIGVYPWIAVALAICAAVAFRAFGGAFPSFPWKTGIFAIFASAGFVAAGKMLGGVLHDRIGALPTIILSFVFSTVLLTFFPERAGLGTAGLFFLNIAMPVTVYLLYRANTKYPAFAFGLCAAALYPGTLAATAASSGISSLEKYEAKVFFVCLSVFAFICVYLAYKKITRHERGDNGDE